MLLPLSGRGRRPLDRHLILDGIWRVLTTGYPWRDSPSEFGNWSSFSKRCRLWSRDGTWNKILKKLQAQGVIDGDLLLVDGSNVRVHKSAAGVSLHEWPTNAQITL